MIDLRELAVDRNYLDIDFDDAVCASRKRGNNA
jgi:hypothetical protein